VPAVTIPAGSGLPYSNVNVTGQQTASSFDAFPSVSIPPVVVSLPDGSGGTTARTATLPPWPQITQGPVGGTSGTSTVSGTITSRSGITSTVVATQPTVTTVSFPSCLSGWFGPTTKVVTFLAPSAGVVVRDCTTTYLEPTTPPPWSPPTTSTTTTSSGPLPVYVTWPPMGTIIPVTETVTEAKQTGGGWVLPCKLWFIDVRFPPQLTL
jgi:hypothetical protein